MRRPPKRLPNSGQLNEPVFHVKRGTGAPPEAYFVERGLVQFKCRLPREVVEKLGVLAARAGVSRTAALVAILRRIEK